MFRLKDKVDELQSIQPILEFAFKPSLTVEDWTKILLHLDVHNTFVDENESISKPFSVQDLLGETHLLTPKLLILDVVY